MAVLWYSELRRLRAPPRLLITSPPLVPLSSAGASAGASISCRATTSRSHLPWLIVASTSLPPASPPPVLQRHASHSLCPFYPLFAPARASPVNDVTVIDDAKDKNAVRTMPSAKNEQRHQQYQIIHTHVFSCAFVWSSFLVQTIPVAQVLELWWKIRERKDVISSEVVRDLLVILDCCT